jgi:hypothetical protein
VAERGRGQVVAVLAIMAGIVVAAALDNRLGWGTLLSVALAIYCHKLYRQPTSSGPTPPAAPEEDEVRPGWAVRWGREPTRTTDSAPGPRQEPLGGGRVQMTGGAPVAAGPCPGTSLGRNRHECEVEPRRRATDLSDRRV